MGEIKPLGSEKLLGNEKLKRILELTYYNEPKKTKSVSKAEIVKESATGGVYGIVKEQDGYYVKKGLNENSLDYIGGLFMKNKNKFSSYGEALKRINLLSGQNNLNEATKYVLKQKSDATAPDMSSSEAPAPDMPSSESPAPDMPNSDMPSPDMSSSESPAPDMSSSDMSSPDMGKTDDNKRSDYMGEIQKFAGKLGQELRDQREKMESDDIKYVLNMVISAVNLNKLDLEDIEEIGDKFDRDEESSNDSDIPTGDEEESPEEVEEPEETESELGETMSKLDEFIRMSAPQQENEISLEKYADIEENDELREFDLDEIKNDINQRIGETLSKYFNK